MNTEEKIFSNGSLYFKAVLHDIEHAENSVDIETYIYDKDHLGDKFAESLISVANKGVHVRISVDGAGSPFWANNYAQRLENAGIKTKVFHPFPWCIAGWKRSIIRLPGALKLLYFLFKINSRNHRKICIIDEKIAYLGSINISKCHLSQEDGGAGWRDAGVRLTGIDLSDLQAAFNAAWWQRSITERLHEAFKKIRQDPVIRLNDSRHRRRILHKHLLRRIAACKHRVWITNAYFVPDNFLLRKLREVAYKGVDVRILLPQQSDIMLLPWTSATFYESLLKSGVRIFEYLPSMLHAKFLIIDQWAALGSTNLNHRSLLHDLEADVKLSQNHSKKQLEKLFLLDQNDASELTMLTWRKNRPFYQRILGKMLLYLKYWF